MKAVRIHEHGGPEKLLWEEMPTPEPGSHEVLVEVRASALNHLDLWVRRGIPGITLPRVLGSDMSGIVRETGSETRKWKSGDEVILIPGSSCGMCEECWSGRENYCPDYRIYGEHRDGVQAEFVSVAESQLLRKPPNLTYAEGAAYPMVFQTAWNMLVTRGKIQPGRTVLILGGAGGVGSAAIRIAKLYRAKVIATAGSEEKREMCTELGADDVVNHHDEEISRRVKEITNGEKVDLVVEHPGAETWEQSMRSLKPGGALVTCGATTGYRVSLDLRFLFSKQYSILGATMGSRTDLLQVSNLMEKGLLNPLIDKVFPVQRVKDAHEYLESGDHTGKTILSFGSEKNSK